MSFGSFLLERALNSTFEPTVTDDLHVDAQGNFTDAQGNKTTPYQQPSWVARTLSDDAHNAFLANQQATLLPNQVKQQANADNSASLDVGNSNWNLLTPEEQNLIPQNRFGLMAGRNLVSPQTIAAQGLSLGDIKGGAVGNQVNADIATSQSTLEAARRRLARQPITEAAGDMGAVNDLFDKANIVPEQQKLILKQFQDANGRYPNIKEAQDLIAQNDLTKAQQEKDILPYTGRANLQSESLRDTLTKEQLGEAPNTVAGMHNRSVLDVFNSRYGDDKLLTPTVNGDSVTLGRRSIYASPMQQQMAMLNAGQGPVADKGVLAPSGTRWSAPAMFTAPTGLSTSASKQVQDRVNAPVGSSDVPPSTDVPPPTGIVGGPEKHHGSSSTKTDDYASLIKEANDAARQYGRTSPHYAQALAKIHSKETEDYPSVISDTDNNPTASFALGNLIQQGARNTGAALRAYEELNKKVGKGLLKGAKGILNPFWQGLTTDNTEE